MGTAEQLEARVATQAEPVQEQPLLDRARGGEVVDGRGAAKKDQPMADQVAVVTHGRAQRPPVEIRGSSVGH